MRSLSDSANPFPSSSPTSPPTPPRPSSVANSTDAAAHLGPAVVVVVVAGLVSLVWLTVGGPMTMLLFYGQRAALLLANAPPPLRLRLGLSLSGSASSAAPPPAPGAARRSGGSSSSEGDSAVAVGAAGGCALSRPPPQNAPPARRWVDRRQSDARKRTCIVLHGRRPASAAAGADLDPPYCRVCFSRRRRRRWCLALW